MRVALLTAREIRVAREARSRGRSASNTSGASTGSPGAPTLRRGLRAVATAGNSANDCICAANEQIGDDDENQDADQHDPEDRGGMFVHGIEVVRREHV